MGGFKSLPIALLMIGLFSLALITFGIQLSVQNDANNSIANDPRIAKAFGNLTTNLGGAKDVAQGQEGVLGQNDPTITSDSIILTAISGVWKVFSSMTVGIYNIVVILIFDSIFGSTFAAVFSVVGAILFILIIFYAWKVVRTGDPN